MKAMAEVIFMWNTNYFVKELFNYPGIVKNNMEVQIQFFVSQACLLEELSAHRSPGLLRLLRGS